MRRSKRSIKIDFRLTPKQNKKMRQAARKRKLTPSKFIRRILERYTGKT